MSTYSHAVNVSQVVVGVMKDFTIVVDGDKDGLNFCLKQSSVSSYIKLSLWFTLHLSNYRLLN